MKHSFKNNSSGKNNKQNKKGSNSNSNFSSLNINSSKSNNKFPINSAKKKSSPNFRESDKNKINHSLFKKRKTVAKSDFEYPKKIPDIYQENVNKKILMIGYGENIQFLRPFLVRELLIEFGVRQKSFLLKNSIFYLRTLNQKEFLLKKCHGTGFHN